jgi:hypothetical protein
VARISEDVLEDLAEKPPVDLRVVASYCDIAQILVEPLPFAGCLGPEDGQLVMRLRAGDSRRRRRFTGFHEVGHSFQPGYSEGRHFRCQSPSAQPAATSDAESLSDVAAVELLLPRRQFVPDLLGAPFGFGTVTQLADAYEASNQATAYRFQRFWPEPTLALVLAPGLRKDEEGKPGVERKLRVRSSHRSSKPNWPYVPRNKSAEPEGSLTRALHGEDVDERASLSELGVEDAGPLELSARRFSYLDAEGELHHRVLALYRRIGAGSAPRAGRSRLA